MASCSLSTPIFQGYLIHHKSQFLGQKHITVLPKLRTISPTFLRANPSKITSIKARFELSEFLGGRGLCYGEVGIQQELRKEIKNAPENTGNGNISQNGDETEELSIENAELPEDVFEKELFGLTGGFPGGEKGLQEFLEGKPLYDMIIKVKNHAKIGLFPSLMKKLKLPRLLSFGNDRDR